MNADFSRSGGLATADAAETATLDDRPLRTAPIRPTGDAGDGWGRAAAYDAYADGLHTYAIWSLRDHDAAADALYCTFVIADHHVTQLRQPEHIQPWLYAIMRRECLMRASADAPLAMAAATRTPTATSPVGASASASANAAGSPSPVSRRLRPPGGLADLSGSLASLERNLRRAEFHSLEWPESEGLAPAHREILELTIRHGLDSNGLGLVLGLGQGGRSAGTGIGGDGIVGSVGSRGFGVLADAWRELERSLAAVAVAKASREHCAQLAELTFGWSGRLTATLRAPLTDHVDGCTRCQHYLHTVIGTPAAPTILPFVAAPRSLREILLGELHDPQAALRLGIDHDAIAARIQRFTPDGFPAIAEPAPVRRRGGRRAAPKGSIGAAKRAGGATVAAAADADTALPRRTPGASGRRVDDAAPLAAASASGSASPSAATTAAAAAHAPAPAGTTRPSGAARVHARTHDDDDPDTTGVYRAPGSWAARVLPPDSESTMAWRPGADALSRSAHPRDKRSDSADSFISTPSGRFALRAPNAPDGLGSRPSAHASAATGAASAGAASAGTRVNTAATAHTARLAAPSPETPRGADGKPRARHKSRPMRQAVISAVALGAVGAAAAASAALLGAVAENHAPLLADPGASHDPAQGPNDGSGFSVSVSTPAAPGGTHRPGVPGSGGNGRAHAPGATVVTGTAGGTAAPSSAPPAGPSVNAAGFQVSVNQRAADPNSVTILLRNTGSVPIAWTAADHDRWITLSRNSGTLAAGQSQTIVATATSAAPAGSWSSTVTFSPGGAVVTLHGYNSAPSSAPTSPSTPTAGSATPSSPGQPSASPSSGSTGTPTPAPSAGSSTAPGNGVSTSG